MKMFRFFFFFFGNEYIWFLKTIFKKVDYSVFVKMKHSHCEVFKQWRNVHAL